MVLNNYICLHHDVECPPSRPRELLQSLELANMAIPANRLGTICARSLASMRLRAKRYKNNRENYQINTKESKQMYKTKENDNFFFTGEQIK